MEYSDDDCFICFDIMWNPTKTPCNHCLCLTCLENILRHKRCCPLCRFDIPLSFTPTIDKERQREIRSKHNEEFSKYRQKMKLQKIFCDTLTITYGNTHKHVTNCGDNTHAWSAFVRLSDNNLDISNFVEKVVFIIHPTFKDPIINVTEAPFKIVRVGWGTFPVVMMIHWKPWLEKEPTKLKHDLCFDGDGRSAEETIKFKKSIFQDNEKGGQMEEEAKFEEEKQQQPQVQPSRPLASNIQPGPQVANVPQTLRLRYGNHHALAPGQSSNGHKWTMFVKLEDNGVDISNYVEKVVYKLHPTFGNPNREIRRAPFELSCVGWGTFDVGVVIYWKAQLGKEPLELVHELSFEGSGDSKVKSIQI